MKYKCKVLTDKFYAKVRDVIDNITKDYVGYKKLLEEYSYWTYFHDIWNSKNDYVIPQAMEELKISIPEYTEQIFDAQEKGFQSQPRILWLGEICKINDINQIISYEVAN